MGRRIGTIPGLAAAFLLISLPSMRAHADVKHVVQRGHTLDAIAHRYHVTVKAIADANHIHDPQRLRVGQELVIPGVNPPPPHPAPANGHGATPPGAHPAVPQHPAPPPRPVTYAARPKAPGVVHGKRLAFAEDFSFRVSDRRGRVAPTTLKTAEHLFRSPGGQSHPIDARLLALLGIVSDHFGSRPIEIISGFRPYTTTQYTAHSNHNVGNAVDFRVAGVPNEALRDFCRTLRNVGCGYYPNSVFVHMDTRATSAFWIDYSKPGEPPHYNAPNLGADEGTSDVGDEQHVAAPSEANAGTDTGAAAPSPGSNPTPPPPADPALNPAN